MSPKKMTTGGYADEDLHQTINDEAIAQQLQDEEATVPSVNEDTEDEEEEEENAEVDEVVLENPVDVQAFCASLVADDETPFAELVEQMTSELELMTLVEMVEEHQNKMKHFKEKAKEALKVKRAETKEERDRLKKITAKEETTIKVKEAQGKVFNIVVRFESQNYHIQVRGVNTLKDIRLILMMHHPDTFLTEKMTAGLIYELNGIVMNGRARRTMSTADKGKSWNITEGTVIVVRRQTAEEKAQAKAKAKAKTAPKSKAAPAKAKAKSSASSGSGTQ
ncbi:unnamed protein product [Effrenium voratum]|nr:unnamed protein product [Effrenium voratum]CAJ1454930.1 unnamed protein product [Effrenium voratum]